MDCRPVFYPRSTSDFVAQEQDLGIWFSNKISDLTGAALKSYFEYQKTSSFRTLKTKQGICFLISMTWEASEGHLMGCCWKAGTARQGDWEVGEVPSPPGIYMLL